MWRPGSAPASISAIRRASHSREAEFVSLMTSLASTGMATGRRTAGSRTTTAAITQVLPYPVFAGPGADPSWNQDAAHTFLPRRRNRGSSIATPPACPPGTTTPTPTRPTPRPTPPGAPARPERAWTACPTPLPRGPGPPSPGGSSPTSRAAGPASASPSCATADDSATSLPSCPATANPPRSCGCATRDRPTAGPSGSTWPAAASTPSPNCQPPSGPRPAPQNKESMTPSSSTRVPKPPTYGPQPAPGPRPRKCETRVTGNRDNREYRAMAEGSQSFSGTGGIGGYITPIQFSMDV